MREPTARGPSALISLTWARHFWSLAGSVKNANTWPIGRAMTTVRGAGQLDAGARSVEHVPAAEADDGDSRPPGERDLAQRAPATAHRDHRIGRADEQRVAQLAEPGRDDDRRRRRRAVVARQQRHGHATGRGSTVS